MDTQTLSPGRIVALTGRSGRGKNRVRELGSRWRLTRIAAGHPFVEDGQLLLEALSDTRQVRWISRFGDRDFAVTLA